MESVSTVLRNAWMAVQGAELPEEVHVVAFQEAVRLIASETNHFESGVDSSFIKVPDSSGGVSTYGSGGPGSAESHMYDRVVQQTGVDRKKLEQIVYLDDDGPKLSIAGIKLGRTSADRTRAVAQILCIVRGFGLDESETPVGIIRAECERLRVLDAPNFASHLKALNGFVINGTGQYRRLRAKTQGVEAFQTLVDSLVGGEA